MQRIAFQQILPAVKGEVSALLKPQENKLPQIWLMCHDAHMESVHSGTDHGALPTSKANKQQL